MPAPAAAAPAAPAAAAQIGGQFLLSLLSDIVANNFSKPFSQASAPSQYDVAESAVSKPYFQGAAPELAYSQYYANEAFRRNLLNTFGFDIPRLDTPEEFMGGVEQRLERQAQSLNERQMKMEQLKREYEYLNELARGRASIEKQEVQSLGDIQRERVGSSYDYAQNVLDSAIKNILVQDSGERGGKLEGEGAKQEQEPVVDSTGKLLDKLTSREFQEDISRTKTRNLIEAATVLSALRAPRERQKQQAEIERQNIQAWRDIRTSQIEANARQQMALGLATVSALTPNMSNFAEIYKASQAPFNSRPSRS
jgi:hypothetical protein